jgi:hypothetical protein
VEIRDIEVGDVQGLGATVEGALLASDEAGGDEPIDNAGDVAGVAVQGDRDLAHRVGALLDSVEGVDLHDGKIVLLRSLAQAAFNPSDNSEQILANLFRRDFHGFIVLLIKYLTTSNIELYYIQ